MAAPLHGKGAGNFGFERGGLGVKNVRFLALGFICAAVVGLLSATADHAQARPQYNKAFLAKYPALADAAKKVKCNVCHEGKSKKMRNIYGKALQKHIGKNEKDKAKIDAALTATEKEPSAVKGKTFGDLIKEGKLPASK